MKLRQDIQWNEQTGVAIVNLIDTTYNEVFTGIATCDKDDFDMKSKLTGTEIAWRRAYIKYLKYLKKTYTIQYNALNNFQKNIENCKHYNKDFQIENMLSKEVRKLENSIIFLKNKIISEQNSLSSFIKAKEEIYQKIRENRNQKQ